MKARRLLPLVVVLLAGMLASAPSLRCAPAKKIKLFGEIDEASYLCSSAGIGLAGKGPPYTVSKISLGSAAAYSGLRPGDKVVHMQFGPDSIVLQIERGGKRYQASVATDLEGLKGQFEKRKIPWSLGVAAYDKQLRTLSHRQIIVLLDCCSSMKDHNPDIPGDLTKWMWCKEQIENLYLATARVLDGGFDLVTFNDKYQRWNGITLFDLRQLFDRVKPDGARKNLAVPLQAVLDDYFAQPAAKRNGCIVVLLSDGVQNLGTPLQNVLIDESAKMHHAGEAIVMAVQVGDSILAEELFDDLDRNLVAKGARYHMVDFKPFTEARNKGVLWELLSTMQRRQT